MLCACTRLFICICGRDRAPRNSACEWLNLGACLRSWSALCPCRSALRLPNPCVCAAADGLSGLRPSACTCAVGLREQAPRGKWSKNSTTATRDGAGDQDQRSASGTHWSRLRAQRRQVRPAASAAQPDRKAAVLGLSCGCGPCQATDEDKAEGVGAVVSRRRVPVAPQTGFSAHAHGASQ